MYVYFPISSPFFFPLTLARHFILSFYFGNPSQHARHQRYFSSLLFLVCVCPICVFQSHIPKIHHIIHQKKLNIKTASQKTIKYKINAMQESGKRYKMSRVEDVQRADHE